MKRQKAEHAQHVRRLWFAVSVFVLALALIALGANPAAAQTSLSGLHVGTDITVQLNSTLLTPQQVQCYKFPTSMGTALTRFGPLPPDVDVSSYYPFGLLVVITTTAALPTDGSGDTVTVTPRDVALFEFDTQFYSPTLTFRGSSSGVPDGAQIDAMGQDSMGHMLLSFDVTVSLPKTGGGMLTVKPSDVVLFDGSAYSLVFDSTAAGVPVGMNVIGASLLPNGHWLIVFDQYGSLGGTDFSPTDVMEYNPAANSWVMSFNGAAEDGWPDGSEIRGVVGDEAPGTPTSTPTATPTTIATPTATATVTRTATATATRTATATASVTSTVTPTASATASPSATATASRTSTATPTATATATPTATATASATSTVTPTASATASPSATATASRTSTATPTASATTTPTATATASATSTVTPTASATGTPRATATLTATGTATPTATATATDSPTPTATATPHGGRMSVKPKKLNLSAAPGSSAMGSITINNVGTGLLIGNVTSPNHNSAFTEKGAGAFSIAPGAHEEVLIVYSPATKGSTSDQIVITCDDPRHKKTIKVKIKGRAR